MGLTSCVYCGDGGRAEALSCPKCHERPAGVRCPICNGFVKHADQLLASRPDSGSSVSYHQTCLVPLFAPPSTVACPDCGTVAAVSGAAAELMEGACKQSCGEC